MASNMPTDGPSLVDWLPLELICCVGYHLPGADVQRFRLTCRRVNAALRGDAHNMAWPPIVFAGSVDELVEAMPWRLDTLTLTSPVALTSGAIVRLHECYPHVTRLALPPLEPDANFSSNVRQLSCVTHLVTSSLGCALLHPRLVDLSLDVSPGQSRRTGPFLAVAFKQLPRLTSLTMTGDAHLVVADCSTDVQDNNVTHVRLDGRLCYTMFEWKALAQQFPHLERLELATASQAVTLNSMRADFPHLQTLSVRNVRWLTFDGTRCPNLVRLEVTGLHCVALDRVWIYLYQGGAPLLRELVLRAECRVDAYDHDVAFHGRHVTWADVVDTHPHLAVVRLTASSFCHRIVSDLPRLDSLRQLDLRVGNVVDIVANATTERWAVHEDGTVATVTLSDEQGLMAGVLNERGWHPVE
jgi:hypothetical protein